MNILQVLPELNVGGVETGTLDLSRQLVRLGHKAVVVSGGGELVKELESFGALHYQLPVHKKSLWTMVKSYYKLIEIIKKEEIDIVHARSRVPAWPAYFAARSCRRVFITTCHGFYSKHPFSYVMGFGRIVIVLSNVIGRHMIDDFFVAHERIRLIPRSVDLDKFKFISPDQKRKDVFNVGIIGRITPIKGHLYFIKAMAKVAKSIPSLKIWIVGNAPSSKEAYKDQLKVLAKRLGLWGVTDFLGTQRDIPGILAHLDVLVLATTTQEAFGRVIIEAQAAGVPVVATRVGGVVDIIEDGKTGILALPADPVSMAEGIIRIHKDKEFAASLAKKAYKKVQDKYNLGLMVDSTLSVYKEALSNFKILIIKFSSTGDIILSTAALAAIRDKFGPSYKISFLVSEESKGLLLSCPYIDELLVCDLKNNDKGIGGILKWAGILRRKNFDLVIDLQNNRKSHLLSFLSFIPDRYGYDNKKLGFLLNHRLKDDRAPIDPITHQFRILKMLGIDLPKKYSLKLWPQPNDENYVNQFLDSQWLSANQKLIGLNISASPRWETKDLPLKHILKLSEELSRKDMRLLLTGSGESLEESNRIMNMVKGSKPINTVGKTTINQLACLIKKCSVYISGDSAPLHVAAAVGVPSVAIFGPTDYRRHLVPADKCIILRKDLACAPCYKPRCKTKTCMESIKPEEILEAIEKLLQKQG